MSESSFTKQRVGSAALAMAFLGLAAWGCSPGAGGVVDAGSVPPRSTSTEPPPATRAPIGASGLTSRASVAVYLIRGERLAKVVRTVPRTARIGTEAVKALVAGPTADERRSGLSTAIPGDTQFRDLTIDAGVAKVDLSQTFGAGAGDLALTLRLAQMTCTLDQFDSIKGVRFALDGRLVDVFEGNGIVVNQPVRCSGYSDYLPGAGDATPAPPFAGIWPYSSAAELSAAIARGDRTWNDPVTTARAFADRYLGMTNPTGFGFRSTGPGAGEVPFAPVGEGNHAFGPNPTTFVVVRQLGAGGGPNAANAPTGPWTVVGARAPDIQVDAPATLALVRSPVTVAGRAHTFEGTVNVEVREDGMLFGRSLGSGVVTGRGDELGPFGGQVSFRSPSKPAGAVVLFERSTLSGGSAVVQATAIRVTFPS